MSSLSRLFIIISTMLAGARLQGGAVASSEGTCSLATEQEEGLELDRLACNSTGYPSLASNKRAEYIKLVQEAKELYNYSCEAEGPCGGCYGDVLREDLDVWDKRGGISREEFVSALPLGVHYQIIDGKLYRQNGCLFPARCKGIEYFILRVMDNLPNMEMVFNVQDIPKAYKNLSPRPVFSFSKTIRYWDIMYPAWTFWSGGPATSVEPKGLGRWDLKRDTITREAGKWPWNKKQGVAFFRGSRTSRERDSVVLLSRARPDLVDAAYTKNQAWKSMEDTLNAAPAQEVRLEDHCQYKYLINFRGVAASFRFKHLFLCHSLVLHMDSEWMEFFYPSLKPWLHYIPVKSGGEIEELLEFVRSEDDIARNISENGFNFIWNHLDLANVQCYWKALLTQYAALTNWTVERNSEFITIS